MSIDERRRSVDERYASARISSGFGSPQCWMMSWARLTA